MTDHMTRRDQIFLQSLMLKKFCTSSEVWKLFRKCKGEENDENAMSASQNEGTELAQQVQKINQHIRDTHMEIKKCVSEEDGSQYFILVNTCDNLSSRLASEYKVSETEYFKKVLEAIIDSDEGRENSRTLLNLTNNMEHKVTKHDAEDILERLVDDFWLIRNENGLYSLSPRCIVEMEPYIQKVFPNTHTCMICRTIAIKGESCTVCGGKVHNHCANKYFVVRKMTKCPEQNCPGEWLTYANGRDEIGPAKRKKRDANSN